MKNLLKYTLISWFALFALHSYAQSTAEMDVTFGPERASSVAGYNEFDVYIAAGPGYVTNNNVYTPNTTNPDGSWTTLNLRFFQSGTLPFVNTDFVVSTDVAGVANGTVTNVNAGGCYVGLPAFNITIDRGTPLVDAGPVPMKIITIRYPNTHNGEKLTIRDTTTPTCAPREAFWSNTEPSNGTTRIVVGGSTEIILPVTLARFGVTKEGTTSLLSWATTGETNSKNFDIQRSSNAKNWATIGTKEAAGESKAMVSYSFTDATPNSGTNYYRLKMIDKDETFAYSSIKSVEFANGKMLAVYPNPVSNVLFLKDIDVNNVKEVSIVSANGITAYKATSVSADGINVAALSNGMYVVKVTKMDGAISSYKIVITK